MSEYNNDGNAGNQLVKIVKKDKLNPERTKFNVFDLFGTLSGAVAGGVLAWITGGWGFIIGGAVAGYILTPHFVPKFFRWLKRKRGNKNF
jgi:outer membrane lipoprotein SlyB